MLKTVCWMVFLLCLTFGSGSAMACGESVVGFGCGGGGGGGGGGADSMSEDGIVNGGGWSQFDPAVTEGIIGADGQLQTIQQNYRDGLKQQQAEQMAKNKKWMDEGDYYEKLEKAGEATQTGVNVAGSILDIATGGATSNINKIGEHTANFVESSMKSYNNGKSASEIFSDAMIETGKKAAKVDQFQKAYDFIKNLENSSPNMKAPPAVNLGTPSPDGSFGAGGPQLDHDSNFLM
jgi:hypothetical protein